MNKSPESDLWRAVVARLMADATSRSQTAESVMIRKSAQNWLKDDRWHKRREFLSAATGRDPGAIDVAAERLESEGWPSPKLPDNRTRCRT